jgi:SAM-dependent methyltransferase
MVKILKKMFAKIVFYNAYLKLNIIKCIVKVIPGLGFYQPIPELNIKSTRMPENFTFYRWEMIKDNLPSNDHISVLDIGCKSGFFCIKMAKMGYFVTGIEVEKTHNSFLNNAKIVLGLNNFLIGNLLIDPNNIKSLPNYDIILLLNVFRHLSNAFGGDASKEMLAILYNKTNKKFFLETPLPENADIHEKFKSFPDMGSNSVEWIKNFFYELGAKDVEELGYNRGRHMFVIHKNQN